MLAFCRQEELSAHILDYWHRRFARQPLVQFAMVEVSPPERIRAASPNDQAGAGRTVQLTASFI